MAGDTLDALERDIPSVAGSNKPKMVIPLLAIAIGAGVAFYTWAPKTVDEAKADASASHQNADYKRLDRDAFASEPTTNPDTAIAAIPGDPNRPPPPPPPPTGAFPPGAFPAGDPYDMGNRPLTKRELVEQAYASAALTSGAGSSGGAQGSGASQYRYPGELEGLAEKSQQLEQQLLASLNQGGAEPDTRNPNSKFLDQVSNTPIERVQPTKIDNLQYLLQAGKMIHASLDTAIDSTLPGNVKATVSQDVYGAQGRVILIPKGSQLFGEYRSAVARGQNRVFTAWNRILTPNGTNIPIGSAGADRLGRTGFQGEVDTHFWLRFREATLLSILGAATANVGVNSASQPNSSDAYREAIATSFQVSSARALEENAQIPDTIFEDQGEAINIFTARDVDFSAVFLSQQR